MLLDVFKADGFTESSLTALINEQPYVPGRISSLGLFDEGSIATTTMQIERLANGLSLVESGPRGGINQKVQADKRTLVPFNVPHLPQGATIMSDEIQNLRAAGSESDVETMTNYVAQRFAKMRRNLDSTIEYHRIRAIQGIVLDADGTTELVNAFTAFNITQQTQNLTLSVGTTDIRGELVAAKRLAEDALGAANITGWRCFMADDVWDDFIAHDDVKAAFDRWEDGAALRGDYRDGFEFAGIVFENYRGSVSGNDFITATEAYLVPIGVPDLFITRFAPADTMAYANTLGLPYYAQQEMLRMNKGVELEAQSNLINLCTRPDAVIQFNSV